MNVSIYEHNFERLIALLPGLLTPRRKLASKTDGVWAVNVGVVERHKYTTIIKLMQKLPLSVVAASPTMIVCIYHDARVAEVLSYQGQLRFSPKYDYPNPKMRQVREKQRVNEFLGEWLDYCLLGKFTGVRRL